MDIDFDKLNALERETYIDALSKVAKAQLTIEDWKKYIIRMRESIEVVLVDEPEYIFSAIFPFLRRKNPKIVELKARLKNYLIFERFLGTKEKAQEVLEQYKKNLQ